MAFLVAAESVTVLTIDPDEEHHNGDNRKSDAAHCLDRRGARVDFEQLPSRGSSISAVLLDYAEQNESDLLVVGPYSRARLKELLVGGTTRTLLAKTPLPTFMSR
jgi:nucleotide-binding universal stress UspA family protein